MVYRSSIITKLQSIEFAAYAIDVLLWVSSNWLKHPKTYNTVICSISDAEADIAVKAEAEAEAEAKGEAEAVPW